MSARTITINPITRLEGHGKIEIYLNENGNVENAYFQMPLQVNIYDHNRKLLKTIRR